MNKRIYLVLLLAACLALVIFARSIGAVARAEVGKIEADAEVNLLQTQQEALELLEAGWVNPQAQVVDMTPGIDQFFEVNSEVLKGFLNGNGEIYEPPNSSTAFFRKNGGTLEFGHYDTSSIWPLFNPFNTFRYRNAFGLTKESFFPTQEREVVVFTGFGAINCSAGGSYGVWVNDDKTIDGQTGDTSLEKLSRMRAAGLTAVSGECALYLVATNGFQILCAEPVGVQADKVNDFLLVWSWESVEMGLQRMEVFVPGMESPVAKCSFPAFGSGVVQFWGDNNHLLGTIKEGISTPVYINPADGVGYAAISGLSITSIDIHR